MPNINLDDTIAAISTPIGEGGIGIVRMSGPQAIEVSDVLFKAKSGKALAKVKPFTVHFGFVMDDERVVDEVLVTVFKSPKSYTSQDMVEISSHGGIVVTRKILDLIFKQGIRAAEPGEFTKRAFLSGRLDLTQAEAVLDVIQAKTDASLSVAQEQLKGSLSKKVKSIKDKLMHVYAHVEAFVDFPQEDLEVYSQKEVIEKIKEVESEINELLLSYQKGEIVREGILSVIVGRPNVGKSSLLNALLDRDRALVSDVPGTTRDALEEMIELEGILFRLCDTAGLGVFADKIDTLSMERTKKYLDQGNVFLWVLDSSEEFKEEDKNIVAMVKNKKVIPVLNKSDLPAQWKWEEVQKQFQMDVEPVLISAKNREGLSELEKRMKELVWEGKVTTEGIAVTRVRHKAALEQALIDLAQAGVVFQNKDSLEFLTFNIKAALDSLSELIGEVYSEDLLDVIFGEFCIGK